MQVSYATQPGSPGIENEDFVAAGSRLAVVLDGVTPVERGDTGCRHGVAWYARMVGSHLFATAGATERPLADCLSEAIDACRKAHLSSCDLTHPDSPAATVTAIRWLGNEAEYLILADSPLVVDTGGGAALGRLPEHQQPDQQPDRQPDREPADRARPDRPPAAPPLVIVDGRPGQVGRRVSSGGSRPPAREFRAMYRNRPDGYWVAAQDPGAAAEALTGTLDLGGVSRILLATDGAARLVDLFERYTWREALDTIEERGPADWLRRTRACESEHAAAGRGPGKPYDDATAVLIRPEPADGGPG